MMLRRAGFTLIELTLVTVIILALVGLSIPLFRKTFSNLSAKDAAFNISKLISYAQEKSVIDRKNYEMAFNFTANQYQLFESKQSTDRFVCTKINNRFGRVFTLPQGLYFKDPSGEQAHQEGEGYKKNIVFYPDGRCDGLTIEILDKKGSGYEIVSKGFGSLIEIKEVASAD